MIYQFYQATFKFNYKHDKTTKCEPARQASSGGKRKKIHQEKMFGSIQACLLAPLVQHQQEAHGPHYSPEQWQQSAMVT